jgi:hypothetical protein
MKTSLDEIKTEQGALNAKLNYVSEQAEHNYVCRNHQSLSQIYAGQHPHT